VTEAELNTAKLDLAKHLDSKIEILLHDFMDRCADLEIEYDIATAAALTVLGHYVAIAAHGVHSTEQEFLAVCRWHFRRMQDRVVA
jgi:hypothetical protein